MHLKPLLRQILKFLSRKLMMGTPVFYAIDNENIDVFKAILEKSPEAINMVDKSNLNVFDCLIKNYLFLSMKITQ